LKVAQEITGVLRGKLLAGDGRVIASRGSIASHDFKSWQRLNLQPGVANANLYFSGYEISTSGVDGPYTVQLELISVHEGDSLYQIKSFPAASKYDHDNFREPVGTIATLTESSVDADSNGITDFLRVDVTIEKPDSGAYEIEGYLYENTEAITKPGVKATDTLTGEQNSCRLEFPVDMIEENRLEPPFRLELRLYRGYDLHNSVVREIPEFRTRECDEPGLYFCGEPVFETVDDDGNGYFDYLLVSFRIRADSYIDGKVCGSLVSTTGDTISTLPYVSSIESRMKNCERKTCKTGVTQFELKFNGQDLFRSGLDGPYVASLRFTSANWLLDEMSVRTPPYKHTDFSHIARIDGNSDRPVDLDGDGTPDWLQVDVKFSGSEAGLYYHRVWVRGAMGVFDPIISSVVLDSIVITGGEAVDSFEISGMEIRRGSADGPRRILVELFKDGRKNDSREFETSHLVSSDFSERTPHLIRLTADTGIERTSNGLYDVLEVSVETKIPLEGTYHLCGRLETAEGTLISARPTPDLFFSSILPHGERNCISFNCVPGIDTLLLEFSGQQIYEKMIDGPYHLKLYLAGGGMVGVIDTATFVTSPHNSDDFRERPMLEYVYTEAYDTSGNGLYDYLYATVRFNPPSAGPCYIKARLSAGSEVLEEISDSLAIEPNTFPNRKGIIFDGSKIARSCMDSPYQLYVELESTDGKIISSETTVIDGYRSAQFDRGQ
jgi:hypothetical protein